MSTTPPPAPSYDDLTGLRVTVGGGVARVVIDHPPINLFDLPLMSAFDQLGRLLERDDDVRVVVVSSADPDFWIAHADVEMILSLPRDEGDVAPTELNFFHAMVDRFRTMPKATIAVLDGAARGGGAELLASFDMRFASSRSVLGQPEVALGILPGGSGTQRLGALVGRSRALEIVLGCGDIDAATAESWGWVNRMLSAGELESFAEELAGRIASFPPGAIAEAKAAVLDGLPDPVPGMLRESQRFARTLQDPAAIERMERFLELGGQTREVERELGDLVDRFDRR